MNKSINSLSVIIPIYNEEKILNKVIDFIIRQLNLLKISYEVILVENGSNDKSLSICRVFEKKEANVKVIHLNTPNYGAALKCGFLASKKRLMINFSVDWVDSDFLKNAIKQSAKYDIILSSKNMNTSSDQRSLTRVWGARLFHTLSSFVIRIPFSDTHGIRLMKRKNIVKVIEQCRMDGEMFETEMLIRSYYRGLSVLEVPIIVKEFRPPRVSIVKRGLKGVIQLIQLKRILTQEGIYGQKK